MPDKNMKGCVKMYHRMKEVLQINFLYQHLPEIIEWSEGPGLHQIFRHDDPKTIK